MDFSILSFYLVIIVKPSWNHKKPQPKLPQTTIKHLALPKPPNQTPPQNSHKTSQPFGLAVLEFQNINTGELKTIQTINCIPFL